MDASIDPKVIEADLLADRSVIPGAVDEWLNSSARSRSRWLNIFGRGEAVRPAFEAALTEVPGAEELWATFCRTEQRELLGAVGHRWFGPRRGELRRVIRDGVLQGPTYPPPDIARSGGR